MNTVLRSTGVLLLFVISITACRKPSDDPAGDPNKLRITRITQSTIREPQPYIFTYTKEGLPETCTITNRLETYIITYTYEEF